ncbi:MAG: alpha/beta hydrolase [Actinomycetota bacterium]|nr:alpha/beta hydrolase [Actinomycetota bacterium]
MSELALDQATISANGLEFAYLATGPESGPLALCLHGFPDSAWTYRHLLPALADAGYRAVAPWMRGYAPTGIPADGRYQSAALALDANRLHEALGGGRDAVLIGHDWGATAVYPAAAAAPQLWSKVVAMAVPPGPAMGGLLQYDQIKRSFYMWFFQLPLAEFIVPGDDFAFIARLWQDWSPGYDGAEDVSHVRDALRHPANLGAALGYYRAAFAGAPPVADPEIDAIAATAGNLPSQPLLYLHGEDDGCIGADMGRAAIDLLSAPSRAEILPGVGHFLHLEAPDVVNSKIVEFLDP